MIRSFLQSSLRRLARIILKRYKPDIIAITGSIGKTGTKEACFSVLKNKFRVRRSLRNYNTEIGVPLTIIGVKNQPGRSLFRWSWVFIRAVGIILIPFIQYPKILILEMAADKPGDIPYFMSFIKPHISIITTLSPVHLANFSKFSQIIAEKRRIVEKLSAEGFAILNFDDDRVRELSTKTKAKIMSYGLKDDNADVRTEAAKVIFKDGQLGLYFKLLYKGTATPVFVKELAASHQIHNLLSAAACGIIYKLTPLEVAEGLGSYRTLSGRFVVSHTSNDIWLIDDTYNAAPRSVCAAVNALGDLPIGKRRIVILADMLELGSYSDNGHKAVAECAAKAGLSFLLTYGDKAELISARARELGMSKQKARHFDDQKELLEYLKPKLKAEDVVLIKGSREMKMEQIVLGLSKKWVMI